MSMLTGKAEVEAVLVILTRCFLLASASEVKSLRKHTKNISWPSLGPIFDPTAVADYLQHLYWFCQRLPIEDFSDRIGCHSVSLGYLRRRA